MQQPIRYYITKNGDEPTLRSVPVAVDRVVREERPETGPAAVSDAVAPREDDVRSRGVSRFVKGAIRKRTPGA